MKNLTILLFLMLCLDFMAWSATYYPIDGIWGAGLRDNNNQPLSAGKVYVYDSGTATATSLYADKDGSANLTNPVVLPAAGRKGIYVGSGWYDITVKDSDDATVFTTSSSIYVGSYTVFATTTSTVATFETTSTTGVFIGFGANTADDYKIGVDETKGGFVIYNITDSTYELYGDGSGNWSLGDGKYLSAEQIRARNADGLYLLADDGLTTHGVYIDDTGETNIGLSLNLREQASAPAATSGYGKLYTLSGDNLLYYRLDDGTTYNVALSSGGLAGSFTNGGDTAGADRTLGNNDKYAMGFETSGEVRLHLTSGGTVGIGTTSPNYNLQLHSAAAGNLCTFQITNAGTGALSTDGTTISENASNLIFNNQEGGNFYFNASGATGSTVMYIKNNNYVGINDVVPDAQLSVVAPDSGYAGNIQIANADIGSAATDGLWLKTLTNGNAQIDNRENASLALMVNGATAETIEADSDIFMKADLTVTNTVEAAYFKGDGSALTGISGFIDGGSATGANRTLGTTDGYALSFITSGEVAMTIEADQDIEIAGNLYLNGNVYSAGTLGGVRSFENGLFFNRSYEKNYSSIETNLTAECNIMRLIVDGPATIETVTTYAATSPQGAIIHIANRSSSGSALVINCQTGGATNTINNYFHGATGDDDITLPGDGTSDFKEVIIQRVEANVWCVIGGAF